MRYSFDIFNITQNNRNVKRKWKLFQKEYCTGKTLKDDIRDYLNFG